MNVLVTGGTGFLGRHLVPFLQKKGMNITVINSTNCNLTDKENLKQFKSQRFDKIYHLAAWTKAGDFCLHHRGEQWIINQQINTNILWFWREFQPNATMISMGTSCAYCPDVNLKEENFMVGEPDRDLYTYAMTKRMLYEGLRALNKQYNMSYRFLIPATLYGPKFDPHDSHFIFDLIKKIVNGKRKGDPVILWGTGDQVRDLMYIDDAISLIDLATENCSNDTLNLGSGSSNNIKKYAELICDIVDYDHNKIIYDTTKFTGVSKKVLSTEKARRLFNFQFTPLKDGLKKTIDYYQSL